MTLVIKNLRCEYLSNPLGIDSLNPRLSWVLESHEQGQCQTAYRIVVASNKDILYEDKGNLWDTGKVSSNQNIHLSYNGNPLKSRMRCYWKVMVWDKEGNASEWSEIALWTMGLLKKSDWNAKWIGLPPINQHIDIENRDRKYFPSPMLRKSFNITNKIKEAFVYVSALGHYELYLNGKRVGDYILSPEWTDYTKKIQYQTYEVTDLLLEGDNAIGAILGDGWYRGNMGPGSDVPHKVYGEDLRLTLQMDIIFEDDTSKEIISDSNWKVTDDGPILMSDHFIGETFDTNKEELGWNSPRFDDSKWYKVTIDDEIEVQLVAQMNESIRVVREIIPISVNEIKTGVFVFDLGQNIAGFCKIRVNQTLIDPNSTIIIRHGEWLRKSGNLYVRNLRDAKATDKYILKNNDEREYHPHFTYHGFQYVEVTGLKLGVKPSLDFLTGCVISSDCPIEGEFESSDSTLNKLWQNILWTQIDNLISVPTDCPQRDERMGWMGDAQVFCQTSIFNMNMAAFYTKWIQDIRDSQRKDGMYPIYVPYPPVYREIDNIQFTAAAWADCGLVLPWTTYLNYNDKSLIKKHYNSAKKFVDLIVSQNKNLLWLKYTGNHYGDWLNGDTIIADDYPRTGAAIPFKIFATAYFANSTYILGRMAEILGFKEDAKKYLDLVDQIKQKFVKRFVNEDGKMRGDTQAGYALALFYNLVPDDLCTKLVKNMIEGIKKYDGRISTGFCSTLPLMMELAKSGNEDIAYDLLFSRRMPSWFFMIDQGATTMWEHWDSYVKGRGFYAPKMNSFNHYSIGSVGEFIYRVILGINLDESNPGYKHIIIKPRPGGPLKWVKGSYNSIYGKIIVHWKIENDNFTLKISIPVNTTATVYLPTRDVESILICEKPYSEIKEVQVVGFKNNIVRLKTKSGRYFFNTKINL